MFVRMASDFRDEMDWRRQYTLSHNAVGALLHTLIAAQERSKQLVKERDGEDELSEVLKLIREIHTNFGPKPRVCQIISVAKEYIEYKGELFYMSNSILFEALKQFKKKHTNVW